MQGETDKNPLITEILRQFLQLREQNISKCRWSENIIKSIDDIYLYVYIIYLNYDENILFK